MSHPERYRTPPRYILQITSVRINRYDWARSPLWLGGLFAPEAFITATRQEVSQRLECSLEELTLQGKHTSTILEGFPSCPLLRSCLFDLWSEFDRDDIPSFLPCQ